MTTNRLRIGLLLSQAAICIVLIAGLYEAVHVRSQLTATLAQQRNNDAVIARIDAQLDSLARGTQDLARQGNPHAATIVAALAQNGVRINDPSTRR